MSHLKFLREYREEQATPFLPNPNEFVSDGTGYLSHQCLASCEPSSRRAVIYSHVPVAIISLELDILRCKAHCVEVYGYPACFQQRAEFFFMMKIKVLEERVVAGVVSSFGTGARYDLSKQGSRALR